MATAVVAAVGAMTVLGRLQTTVNILGKQDGGCTPVSGGVTGVAAVPFGPERTSGGSLWRAVFPQLMVSRNGGGPFSTTSTNAMINVAAVVQGEGEKEQQVPLPVVHIDQHSDPDATIVELSFGDRLGALLDTTKALKNLGLSVVKAKVVTEGSKAKNKFYITRSDNGNKVENPELLEAIRLTIINNLLKYHPESSEQLVLGETFGVTPPKVKLDVDVATHIGVKKVNPKQSLLKVETADRPGLLLEIIKVISDISVTVESAEIDTEGLVARDEFYVSYGGAALSKSLEEVLTNCLRYYIRKTDTEDESY